MIPLLLAVMIDWHTVGCYDTEAHSFQQCSAKKEYRVVGEISPELIKSESYYIFDPKSDITAYELSKILNTLIIPALSGVRVEDWDARIMALGVAARHFKRFPTQ